MDLRYLAMAAFITAWATLGGVLSGFVMGLFFLVYQDGCRRGVLPPQGDRPLSSLVALPTVTTLTSRLIGDYRHS